MKKVLSVFAIVTSIFLAGCSDPCLNTQIERLSSPDHEKDVVIFVRDCGATSTWSTQISIVGKGKATGQRGNILIVDDGDNEVERNAAQGPLVTAKWVDAQFLEVTYAKGARIHLQEVYYAGVEVSYRPK